MIRRAVASIGIALLLFGSSVSPSAASASEAPDSAALKTPPAGEVSPESTGAGGAAKKPAKSKKKGARAAKGGKGGAVGSANGAAAGTMPVPPATTPGRVQVQHILIGFAGSVPGKAIQRSQAEAKKLAYEVLERARKGEDFGSLVAAYTDDSPPGIYGMSGRGVATAQGEYPRDGMVPAFGNVGFAISPGNIGIADYDPAASPFGWHVIKRLK